MTNGYGINVELCIPPEWARIDPVRQAIGLCIAAVFSNEDLRDALGMVCAELLENAIKYGKPAPHNVSIRLAEQTIEGKRQLTLSVTNSAEHASHHLAMLQQRLDWIDQFEDPSEAYFAALDLIYKQGGEGGLGLVRIAYEGGCHLECESPAEGQLTMRARYFINASEPTRT